MYGAKCGVKDGGGGEAKCQLPWAGSWGGTAGGQRRARLELADRGYLPKRHLGCAPTGEIPTPAQFELEVQSSPGRATRRAPPRRRKT